MGTSGSGAARSAVPASGEQVRSNRFSGLPETTKVVTTNQKRLRLLIFRVKEEVGGYPAGGAARRLDLLPVNLIDAFATWQ